MRKKLKSGGVAEGLLRQTLDQFMERPQFYPAQSTPEDERFDQTLGATMLAQPVVGTTALQNYGKGYLAADAARTAQANEDARFGLHEEELKHKMINTLVTVNQYKEENEFKNRELGVNSSIKSRMRDETERHHLIQEELGRQKLGQGFFNEKNKALDKIISRSDEIGDAFSAYEKMKADPSSIDQHNKSLGKGLGISNKDKFWGLFSTGSDNIDTAKLMHYPDYLAGKIANKLKNMGVSPDEILRKVDTFKKNVAAKNPKNIPSIDSLAIEIIPELGARNE